MSVRYSIGMRTTLGWLVTRPDAINAVPVWRLWTRSRFATCTDEADAHRIVALLNGDAPPSTALTFAEAITLARAALERRMDDTPSMFRPTRAGALVLTKLDEAELWFTRTERLK